MPFINFSMLKASTWREDMYTEFCAANAKMVERFSVEDLYPAREIQQEDGTWKEYKQVQPHQQKIHDGVSLSGQPFKFCLFNSGYGAGKSITMSVQMLYLLRKFPGIRCLTVAPYDWFFDESVWPTRRDVLEDDDPLIEKLLINQRRILFKNGSEWWFRAYEDASRIRGFEVSVVHIEEGGALGDRNNEKALAIWYALLGRLRQPGNYPKIMYVTQNPEGHNWAYKIFVKNSPMRDDPKVTEVLPPGEDPERPYGVYYREWEYVSLNGDVFYTISTGTAANKLSSPGYLSSMYDQFRENPKLLARSVEGNFDPIHGLVYDEPNYSPDWNAVPKSLVLEAWELNRTDEYDFPKDWPLWVGIDCAGQRSPWAVEFYVETPAQELLGIGEIYRMGDTWDEIADRILDWTTGWRNINYWIDPISSQHRSGPNRENIQREFALRGIPTNTPLYYKKAAAVMHFINFLHPDHRERHPYLRSDYLLEDQEIPKDFKKLYGDAPYWNLGAPRVMYLTDPDNITDKNPMGYFQPANIAEKGVWRFDDKPQRQPKEYEEGLTPVVSEKILDRDDHAQTAELFIALGYSPMPRGHRTEIARENREESSSSVYRARKRRWRE